jgi:hypothetical protein
MTRRADGAPWRASTAGFWLGASLVALVLSPALALAQTAHVVKVEEDWELVLLEPAAGVTAPQLTCTISPVAQSDTLRAAFDLNHASAPSFSAGGMQLQVWQGDQCVATKRKKEGVSLSQTGETVKWTMRMSLPYENTLKFSVKNGTSNSWGAFGTSSDTFSLSLYTSLNNLDAYSSSVSVAQSGVGFAGNRVSSLTLKEVRRTWSNGEVTVDNAPKTVHPE